MTFANAIGRAIGASAAYTAHAAAVGAKSTGRFGADVVIGTTEGYADHSERLAAQRKLAYAAPGAPKSIAISVAKRKAVAA